MHVVALRHDIVRRHPWIPANFLRAFEEAKNRSVARALEVTAPRFPIPWCYEHARRAHELFGADHWPYGLGSNRTTLDAFLQFASEQGAAHRRLRPGDLFPPQVTQSFKILIYGKHSKDWSAVECKRLHQAERALRSAAK